MLAGASAPRCLTSSVSALRRWRRGGLMKWASTGSQGWPRTSRPSNQLSTQVKVHFVCPVHLRAATTRAQFMHRLRSLKSVYCWRFQMDGPICSCALGLWSISRCVRSDSCPVVCVEKRSQLLLLLSGPQQSLVSPLLFGVWPWARLHLSPGGGA